MTTLPSEAPPLPTEGGRSSRVDRISARAATVDFRKVLLTLLLLVPFVLFYAARLVVRAAAWLWAAGVEGWEAAGPKREAG